jgi:RNA recognition motif-containing protein
LYINSEFPILGLRYLMYLLNLVLAFTDDFRLFCGDLGNDVTDEVLTRVFGRYPSFQKAKVVRDKRSNKTKGFGFVSFKDPNDFVRAIKELDGKPNQHMLIQPTTLI